MTHSTLEFLRLLDPAPDASFNFETFTDLPKGIPKPKPDTLLRRFANVPLQDVSQLIPTLERLNKVGAAVYVAVNEFKGHRNKPNLSKVRGVHADFDDVSDDVLANVRTLLPPTIEVQSSKPGNCHFYWLLEPGEELDASMAEAINRRLVELGSDKAAVDVSRLLRLPGFRHMKHHAENQND